jgi:hypothetical protein
MRTITFIAALTIGVIDPPHIDLAQVNVGLMHFSEHSLALIQRTFTPVKAETEPIDAKAAATLDEDLDWRIASAAKNDAALRAFLAKHPKGAHAGEAQLTLDKIIGQSAPPAPPPKPVAVPLLTPPVVDVANAPPQPQPNVFAKLEEQAPPPRTIIKWKYERSRTVVEWRYARHRFYRPPPPPPNFFQALFGPRQQPRHWYMQR